MCELENDMHSACDYTFRGDPDSQKCRSAKTRYHAAVSATRADRGPIEIHPKLDDSLVERSLTPADLAAREAEAAHQRRLAQIEHEQHMAEQRARIEELRARRAALQTSVSTPTPSRPRPADPAPQPTPPEPTRRDSPRPSVWPYVLLGACLVTLFKK